MSSNSPSGCQAQAQGVRMIWKYNVCKTVNKYAKMVETIIDDIFGFCIVNARYKSVFVFLDF